MIIQRCVTPLGGFRSLIGLARRLHRCQDGSISIMTVFTVLLLAMLLGMVMNAGVLIDGKIRMQNAADSVAYTGGLVVARNMNTIVFTNHLLSEVFAQVALLREARDREAEKYVPDILAAYSAVAPTLSSAQFQKFADLGQAMPGKIAAEQQMVDAFMAWANAYQEPILPVYEEILRQEMIPNFQQAVVQATPMLAQAAAHEIASRYSHGQRSREMVGVLWRTEPAEPVAGPSEGSDPLLPLADPVADTSYQAEAKQIRDHYAEIYLIRWNGASEGLARSPDHRGQGSGSDGSGFMHPFDGFAKMTEFGRLWRNFTHGQLWELANVEYPNTNLPMLLRNESRYENSLERDYMVVGTCYWPQNTAPYPLSHPGRSLDQVSFAQANVYIADLRIQWVIPTEGGSSGGSGDISLGGLPGIGVRIQGSGNNGDGTAATQIWPPIAVREGMWLAYDTTTATYVAAGQPDTSRTQWDTFNQRWMVRLVPATHAAIPTILSTDPSQFVDPSAFAADAYPAFNLPNLTDLTYDDLILINTH